MAGGAGVVRERKVRILGRRTRCSFWEACVICAVDFLKLKGAENQTP